MQNISRLCLTQESCRKLAKTITAKNQQQSKENCELCAILCEPCV